MDFGIKKSEIKALTKIAKRIVIQSDRHESNIIRYYRIIAEAARDEFTEDNKYSLDSYLVGCHKKSLEP